MKVHRTTSELHDTIEGYKTLIEEQRKEINKNLLHGYKKVIEDLQDRLNKVNVR